MSYCFLPFTRKIMPTLAQKLWEEFFGKEPIENVIGESLLTALSDENIIMSIPVVSHWIELHVEAIKLKGEWKSNMCIIRVKYEDNDLNKSLDLDTVTSYCKGTFSDADLQFGCRQAAKLCAEKDPRRLFSFEFDYLRNLMMDGRADK